MVGAARDPPVQVLSMCRHAMAYAVLALSTFSAKSFAGAARKPSPQLLPKSTALGLNALSLGPRPGRGGDAAKVQSRQQATTLLCMAFENAASVLERTGKKVGPSLSIPVTECSPLLRGVFARMRRPSSNYSSDWITLPTAVVHIPIESS